MVISDNYNVKEKTWLTRNTEDIEDDEVLFVNIVHIRSQDLIYITSLKTMFQIF